MADYDTPIPQKILTVTELNRHAKSLLERSFPLFWLTGEISNFTRAASGHWYFSLKDTSAQVSCVMFKGRNSYVDFMPRDGDKIEARATVTLYESRGSFQLTIEFIQKAGLGVLFEAFEKLKLKLEHEGLFDPAFKQTIPQNPACIGIVTSPDAAALRDVITTLNRRNPKVKVIIYPTPVQGKDACKQIAQAIHQANQRQEVETLIICRGGGSLEDLWQFNEEMVARAIDECSIPTVSGVGHETDFTICDFVADLRAPTPTAAAELACVDIASLQNYNLRLQQQLTRLVEGILNGHAQKLDFLSRRLISPKQQLKNQQIQLNQLSQRMHLVAQQQLQKHHQILLRLASGLEQLNPQNVLARGYALVKNQANELVTNSQQLKSGDQIHIQLHTGEVDAIVGKPS